MSRFLSCDRHVKVYNIYARQSIMLKRCIMYIMLAVVRMDCLQQSKSSESVYRGIPHRVSYLD